MKQLRFLAFALAAILALPASDARTAAIDCSVGIVAIGTADQKAVSTAKAAACTTVAYLEANGIPVFRDVPRTVKLYGTAELFVVGIREGGVFGEPHDEDKFVKERDLWAEMSGTVTKGIVHVNLSVFAADNTTTLGHVVAHEFTHLIQYETSGYRHKTDHRWLVEGTAELVAFAVTERLAGRSGNFARGIGNILGNLKTQKSLPILSALADASVFNRAINELGKNAHKIVYGVSTLGAWFLLVRTRKPLKSLFDYMAAYRDAPTNREANFTKTFGIGTADFYALFEVYLASVKK